MERRGQRCPENYRKDRSNVWAVPLLALSLSLMSAVTQANAQAFSPSFELGGEVAETATIELADLQALPTQELEVTYTSRGEPRTHTYTGVLLYDLLQEAEPEFSEETKNDALAFYVRVGATDGYVATVSWGEIDPDFGNQPVLVAFEEDGELMNEDGMARLVVPGDAAGGRYVSNISDITLLRAAAP